MLKEAGMAWTVRHRAYFRAKTCTTGWVVRREIGTFGRLRCCVKCKPQAICTAAKNANEGKGCSAGDWMAWQGKWRLAVDHSTSGVLLRAKGKKSRDVESRQLPGPANEPWYRHRQCHVSRPRTR